MLASTHTDILTRRNFLAMLAGAGSLTLLSACGSSSDDEPASTPEATDAAEETTDQETTEPEETVAAETRTLTKLERGSIGVLQSLFVYSNDSGIVDMIKLGAGFDSEHPDIAPADSIAAYASGWQMVANEVGFASLLDNSSADDPTAELTLQDLDNPDTLVAAKEYLDFNCDVVDGRWYVADLVAYLANETYGYELVGEEEVTVEPPADQPEIVAASKTFTYNDGGNILIDVTIDYGDGGVVSSYSMYDYIWDGAEGVTDSERNNFATTLKNMTPRYESLDFATLTDKTAEESPSIVLTCTDLDNTTNAGAFCKAHGGFETSSDGLLHKDTVACYLFCRGAWIA